MKLKTIGNALIIFAFLLSCAGIVEPSNGISAAVAMLVFIGFAVITTMSHHDWTAGYEAAQTDMTFVSQQEDDEEPMWKCGLDGCDCATDPRYREVSR